MILKKNSIPVLSVLVLIAFVLVASGCATKKQESYLDDKLYVQEQEEEITEPYTPRDDGIQLSAEELKAFTSRGQLDADLSQEDSQIVELHFKAFIHHNRATFERFLARSARYLPYAKKVFAEKGLPEEMAYLFIIESGGNPNAYSRAKATGLWQFMSFTGKKFGLEQSTWYDARRDPYRSTQAAADYLLLLHSYFNDWHLAAAAYNAGEGKIGRALTNTGAKDFFELCDKNEQLNQKARLRTETLQYVPSLIAVAKIMRNLELLGFTAPSPEEAYNLTPVSVPPGTSLTHLSRSVNLTWDEFAAMNPAFKRTASPPSMTTTAYLPPALVSAAQTWLDGAESRMYAGWKEYKVKRGDTLNSLAKRNKTSVAAIQKANSISKLPSAGQIVLIPGGSREVEPVLAALPEKGQASQGRLGKHTVQAGESLSTLASDWGTSIGSIQELNKLSSANLQIGQILSIPSDSNNYKSQPKSGIHIVRRGDTLGNIASDYGTSVGAIMQANKLTSKSKLQLGQKIYINSTLASKSQGSGKKASKSSQEAKTGKKPTQIAGKTYTIQSGDTLGKLASANNTTVGDIMRANDLNSKSKLSIGQVIVLPKTVASKAVSSTQEKATPLVINIKKGDTLYSLARKHNTSVELLLSANKLTPDTTLKLGQKLIIP